MKRNLAIIKVLIGLVGLTLTSCSAWRYNTPRVSVDREKAMYVNTATNVPIAMLTTQNHLKENGKIDLGSINKVNISKPVSNITPKVKVNSANSETSIQHLKNNSPLHLFAKQVRNKKPCKIEHAEKATATGWVRIMIIFFAVGLILLLVGIFLSVFLFGPFWWLFYALGSLLILAAIIILILVLIKLI